MTIETHEEYRAMKKYVQDQQAIGLDVQLLDRDLVVNGALLPGGTESGRRTAGL